MRKQPPAVLTIAGSDSSGGAGIQADIKTISATGCYAASVITALTAQNTQGVQAIDAVSAEFVAQQIESVMSDLEIKAVKIGMLHQAAVIHAVLDTLKKYHTPFMVIDPVMVSKSGHALLDANVIDVLKRGLFPLATLITPNLPETETLLNKKIATDKEQEDAAVELGQQIKTNVLVKGGHRSGDEATDVLYLFKTNEIMWFPAERIMSTNTHGTGCSLSSAIASYLAQGASLVDAIQSAKYFLTNAIKSSKEWQLGRGFGPIDHFYKTI